MTSLDRFASAAIALLCLSACAPDTAPVEPEDERSTPLQPTTTVDAMRAETSAATAAAPAGTASSRPVASTPIGALGSTTSPPTAAGAAGAAAQATPPPAAAAAAPMCVALRACCATLPDARERALCQGVAEQRVDDLCKVAGDDYCAAPTTNSTPASPALADCMTLNSCCATLDEEDQEDCLAVVDAAVAVDCRASVDELCPNATTMTAMMPGAPATGACAMLSSTCCTTLEDDEDIEECQAAVSDAIEAACQETLDALCGAGGND